MVSLQQFISAANIGWQAKLRLQYIDCSNLINCIDFNLRLLF